MDRFELTQLLIQKVDEYAKGKEDGSNLSLEDFILHLKSERPLDSYKNTLLVEHAYPEEQRVHHRPNNIERIISQHLLILYRYIKFYSKHVFVDSKIRSVEDFGIIMTVLQHNQISKSDLIKRNIIEKSSGIEIINRLIKQGLLFQKDNPNDNRSQLIFLSDAGRMEVFKLFEKMETLGYIATGELSEAQKYQLADILKQLDTFHFANYTNKKLKDLKDYLPKK
ncbi:MAG TPA: helix-turn-helix domain-containing protein [Taishania sp.]|nr:helix-turn-helix domain-containing protein [Taishania sp.]